MNSPISSTETRHPPANTSPAIQLLTFFSAAFLIAWAAWIPAFTIVSMPLPWALFSALTMPALYLAVFGAIHALTLGASRPLLSGGSPIFVAAAFLWLLFVNSGEEIGCGVKRFLACMHFLITPF